MKYYVFEILRSSAKAEEFSLPPHFYIPGEDQPPTSSKDPKQESNAPIQRYSTCTYCGKGFETDQAKLDHTRIHPDRNLKGTPKRPAADVESNTNFLLPKSWAATRKYVWKPVTDKNSPDAIAAALTLVEMSRSKPNWSYQNKNSTMESDPLDEKKHVSENYNRSFPSDQALVQHGSSHQKERKNETILEPTSRKRKMKVKSESGSHVCEICNKSYAMGQQLGGHKRAHYPKPENPTPLSEVPNGQVSDVPNWSYQNKNMTMESDPLDEKKHVSENCNKSFPSNQALVEHGSSHKKERKNEAIILEPTSRKRKRKVKSKSGSHVCEICNKSYAMGQQLGGHKRIHYPKPKNPTPINEVPNGQVSEVPNGQAAPDS